jgi:peptide/nickel transport system substrate-binding protein
MLRTRRAAGSAAVLAVAGLVLTACGGSSSSSSPPNPNNTSSSSGANFSLISADNTGTPQRGGVLKVAGSGDADYLDPNVSYSSLGYTASRLYSRQLYTYSSQLGHTTDVVPDLATGAPVVSNGGKTLTITIRQGADWNTTP